MVACIERAKHGAWGGVVIDNRKRGTRREGDVIRWHVCWTNTNQEGDGRIVFATDLQLYNCM